MGAAAPTSGIDGNRMGDQRAKATDPRPTGANRATGEGTSLAALRDLVRLLARQAAREQAQMSASLSLDAESKSPKHAIAVQAAPPSLSNEGHADD
jgi:hypothetical protein